jgi:endoglucanase
MKRRFYLSIIFIFILLVAGVKAQITPSSSNPFVRVEGKKVLAPNGQPLLIKGIGLGNWLLPEGYMWRFKKAVSPRQINEVISELIGPAAARKFWKKYRENYITKQDIAYLKEIGMNSVRVPINYRVLTPENNPGVWLKSGFQTLDNVINWCSEEGMYVILDMHAAPGGQTGENIDDGWGYPFLFKSRESQKRVIGIWKKLAERYHNNPTVLGYDLLNEPIPTFKEYASLNQYLVPLYKRITKAIRKVDPNHIIIVEGAQWATNFKVFGKPFDNKMIYSFHKYWMPPKQDQIQEYIDYGKKYNVPIWLGESGENTDQWVEQFRLLLEKNDIGWSFWPYKKMESPRGIVTMTPPANWDKITTFAADWGDSFKDFRKDRPSMKEAQTILDELLKNIRFRNCTPNNGYIKALGLKP